MYFCNENLLYMPGHWIPYTRDSGFMLRACPSMKRERQAARPRPALCPLCVGTSCNYSCRTLSASSCCLVHTGITRSLAVASNCPPGRQIWSCLSPVWAPSVAFHCMQIGLEPALLHGPSHSPVPCLLFLHVGIELNSRSRVLEYLYIYTVLFA